jgi:hypothetical protein
LSSDNDNDNEKGKDRDGKQTAAHLHLSRFYGDSSRDRTLTTSSSWAGEL